MLLLLVLCKFRVQRGFMLKMDSDVCVILFALINHRSAVECGYRLAVSKVPIRLGLILLYCARS